MAHAIRVAQASRRATRTTRKDAENRFLCFRRRPLFPGEGVRVTYSQHHVLGEATIIAYVTLHADGGLKRMADIARLFDADFALFGRPQDPERKLRRVRIAWRYRGVRPGTGELRGYAVAIADMIRSETDLPVYVSPFRRLTSALHEAAVID
jgi:hypothetical protein